MAEQNQLSPTNRQTEEQLHNSRKFSRNQSPEQTEQLEEPPKKRCLNNSNPKCLLKNRFTSMAQTIDINTEDESNEAGNLIIDRKSARNSVHNESSPNNNNLNTNSTTDNSETIYENDAIDRRYNEYKEKNARLDKSNLKLLNLNQCDMIEKTNRDDVKDHLQRRQSFGQVNISLDFLLRVSN